MSLALDIKFGINAENKVINRLKVHFEDEIIKTTDKYCRTDAIGKKRYEIKTRRNKKRAYPTTIITVDKIAHNDVFVFNFSDKLCYIEYDKDKFEKYEIKPQFYERDGVIDPYTGLHLHIPIDDLMDID